MLFFCTMSIFLSTLTYSQNAIKLKGGLNFAQMAYKDGTTELQSSNFTCIQLGLVVEHKISENLYIEPGFIYSKKGSNFIFLDKIQYNVNYFDLPINLVRKINVADDLNISLKAGPYIGLAFSGKIRSAFLNNGQELIDIGNNPNTDVLKPFDLGITIGTSIDYKKATFGLQYSHSLNNLSPDVPNNIIIKNKIFSIYLAYQIGKK